MSQYFIDRAGSIRNVRRTAVGGLLLDARLAKVGVLEYREGERVVRRYNPPQVLEAVLPQVSTLPVTNRHPSEFVNTKNYSKLAAGHVVGMARMEDGHIVATLAVNDENLIRDIEMGLAREVSLGYMATHDGKPGSDDQHQWDEARVSLELNHCAIVPAGRAGATVCLQLDSAEIPNDESASMKFKIGGVEVEATDAQAAIDSLEAKLQAEVTVAQAALDKANEQLAAAQKQLDEATSDEAINALVEKRIQAQKDAAEFAAKVERVRKAFPKVDESKLTNREYVDALDFARSDTAVFEAAPAPVPATDSKPVDPYEKLAEATRNAWRTKV